MLVSQIGILISFLITKVRCVYWKKRKSLQVHGSVMYVVEV